MEAMLAESDRKGTMVPRVKKKATERLPFSKILYQNAGVSGNRKFDSENGPYSAHA